MKSEHWQGTHTQTHGRDGKTAVVRHAVVVASCRQSISVLR